MPKRTRRQAQITSEDDEEEVPRPTRMTRSRSAAAPSNSNNDSSSSNASRPVTRSSTTAPRRRSSTRSTSSNRDTTATTTTPRTRVNTNTARVRSNPGPRVAATTTHRPVVHHMPPITIRRGNDGMTGQVTSFGFVMRHMNPFDSDSDDDDEDEDSDEDFTDYMGPPPDLLSNFFASLPTFIMNMRRNANNEGNHFHSDAPKDYVNVGNASDSNSTNISEVTAEEKSSAQKLIQDLGHECSICQDDVDTDLDQYCSGKSNLVVTPCGHVFHSSCLHEWLENNSTCPLCRHELTYNAGSFASCVKFSYTIDCESDNVELHTSYDRNVFKSQVEQNKSGISIDISLYQIFLKMSEVRLKNILMHMYRVMDKFKECSASVQKQCEKFVKDYEEEHKLHSASKGTWNELNITNMQAFQQGLQYNVMKQSQSSLESNLAEIETKFRIKVMSLGLNSVDDDMYWKTIWSSLGSSLLQTSK
jgi:hypothetical protein